MSRGTRSRSKEKVPNSSSMSTPSPRNLSGRRISPRAVGDSRISPRAFNDNSSYRSHDASDEEESCDNSLLDSSQDSVDHAASHHSSFEHSDSSYSYSSKSKTYRARVAKQANSPGSPANRLYPDLSAEFSPDREPLKRRGIKPRLPSLSPEAYRQQARPQHTTSPPRGGAQPHPQDDSAASNFFNFCLVCIVGVVFLAFYFIAPLFFSAGEVQSNLSAVKSQRGLIVARFEDSFKEFQSKFPSQSSTMLRTIKAASKSVMKEDRPLKPGVIMLVGNRGAFDTVDCIAKHVLSMAGKAFQSGSSIEIQPEELRVLPDYHAVKKHLDMTLRDGFKESKVALVHNMEKIHGKAAILFHAFCDNENAPFKDTVIIFTVHVDTDEPITDEDEVETYLDAVWAEHLELDSRSPLMTRIANFVAIVTEENEEIIQRHC